MPRTATAVWRVISAVLLLSTVFGSPAAGQSGSVEVPGGRGEDARIALLHGDHGPEVEAGRFLTRLSPRDLVALDDLDPQEAGFGWYLVTSPRDLRGGTPDQVRSRLEARIGRPVIPNLTWRVLGPETEPGFPQQWPLSNVGGSGGLPGADISVVSAWQVTLGSPETVVGVIDTGVDLDHPDLIDRLVPGWDFADGDATPDDTDGHGTAVAGVAAAAANGVGLVGVAPQTRIMPLKVCNFTGGTGCTDATVIEALAFAADRGVRIVNISLGRLGAGSADAALKDAIAEAGRRGVLVVAAAGNSASDNDVEPVVPASLGLGNVLSVAATDRRHALSPFSNYGRVAVDLGAPGQDVPALWTGTDYAARTVSGTSFAAPHVTGVAALVHSANPCLSPAQTAGVIMETVDPMAALEKLVASGGVVDADRAVARAGALFASPRATPAFGSPPLTVALRASSTCGSGIAFEWSLSDGRTAGGSSASMTYPTAGVSREYVTVTRGALAQQSYVDVPAGPQFGDDNGSVFEGDIAWLAATGVTRGCAPGRYCPNDSVTRGQMGSFLARFLGLPPASRDYFDDDGGSVHEDAINSIAEAEITLGCAPGLYCPNDRVTREQMASLMARALQLPGSPLDVFQDDDGVHEQNINALALTGVTRGCGGASFCPSDPVTRGQMAAFLSRSRDLLP